MDGHDGDRKRECAPGTGAVTVALANPAAQACALMLGCAVIHAARVHAEFLTRLLVTAIVGVTVLLLQLLLAASVTYAPGADESFDAVTVYAAS